MFNQYFLEISSIFYNFFWSTDIGSQGNDNGLNLY